MNQVHNFVQSTPLSPMPDLVRVMSEGEYDRLCAIWSRAKDMKTVVALLAEVKGHHSDVSDILWMLHREFDAIEAIANPPSELQPALQPLG